MSTNTKKNFIVYFKGKRRTVKIDEYASLIEAQKAASMLRMDKRQSVPLTNKVGVGYPFISFSNPLLVKRMQVYG